MKQIDLAELTQKYSHERAIFFTKDGKIVVENHNPFLPVAKTLDRLGVDVQAAYQNELF